MSYRSHKLRRLSKRNKRNFLVTIILVGFILYATFSWILPSFVNAIGLITSFFKPQSKLLDNFENPKLAPPVLNISYEATNTAYINIAGYATPLSKVNLYIDDEKRQTEDVSLDGKFLFQDVELALGINNIYGKTQDEQHKESLASKTIRVIFDNETPKLEISNPQDGLDIHVERKITVEGITEADARVFVNGSQVIVDKDGKFKLDQSLNDGENIFVIKAVDKASNETEDERRVNFTP